MEKVINTDIDKDCGQLQNELTQVRKELKQAQDELDHIVGNLNTIRKKAKIKIRPNLSQIEWSVLRERIDLIDRLIGEKERAIKWTTFKEWRK